MPDETEEVATVGNWPTNLNGGELKVMMAEEHLCFGCLSQVVCKVANAIEPEMMTVISRCAMYLDAGDEPE